jgi:excisionase family DNA binding protein
MNDSIWLTAPEAAQALGIAQHTVRRLIRVGVLAGNKRSDGSYRVKAASVYHYRATRQGGSK